MPSSPSISCRTAVLAQRDLGDVGGARRQLLLDGRGSGQLIGLRNSRECQRGHSQNESYKSVTHRSFSLLLRAAATSRELRIHVFERVVCDLKCGQHLLSGSLALALFFRLTLLVIAINNECAQNAQRYRND